MMQRWRRYQEEMLPLVPVVGMVAVWAIAAVGYSARVQAEGQAVWSQPETMASVVGAIALWLFWVQFHIARTVQRYLNLRPQRIYSPSQAGYVTPRELGVVAIATGLVQLGLAIPLGWRLVLLLVGIWLYLWLLSRQFFADRVMGKGWRDRPMPAWMQRGLLGVWLSIYAMAGHWLLTDRLPLPEMAAFWGVAFLSGAAAALVTGWVPEGRRRPRVPSQPQAVAWLGTLWLMALVGLGAAWLGDAVALGAIALLLILTAAMIAAWRLVSGGRAGWAIAARLITHGGTLLLYGALGIAPFWLAAV